MIDVDLAFPLSLGLVAAFNPCGFAMLPAYVSYFLGLESDDETNVARNVVRGVVVGITMTLGFVVVFGLIGLLTSTFLSEGTISRRVPYATLTFGVLMIPLGIAMLRGFEPKLNIPRLQVGGRTGQLPSIFLFGVSYAVVSISCTIGLFLTAVADSFGRDGIVDGTAVYVAYASGMGLVIMVLTIGVALARNSVATNMRRVLPHVNKISGAMLMVAGAYLIVYGWWEIQVLRGNVADNAIVDLGERVQSRISNWIADVGATRLAMAITVLLVGAVVFAVTASLARSERLMVRGGFVAVALLLEALRYDFDLLLLPAIRTIADVPERVLHWFTDPFRWPVLFEVLLAAIVVALVWFGPARRLRRRLAGGAPDDSTPNPIEQPVA